jgi:multifunctional beta-oxidation protein
MINSVQKCGLIGFCRALGYEGAKYNISVNAVAPVAGTAMTATVSPPDVVAAMKPDYVAPLIALLCSEVCPSSSGLYEAGPGNFANTRWERARGVDFNLDDGVPTAEAVRNAIAEICNFDNGKTDHPALPSESGKYSTANIMRSSFGKKVPQRDEDRVNRKYLNKIAAAINSTGSSSTYIYTEKDTILYNLSLGAHAKELPLVYENDENFQILPSIGVIPPFFARPSFSTNEILPKFNPKLLVHGEQYFEVHWCLLKFCAGLPATFPYDNILMRIFHALPFITYIPYYGRGHRNTRRRSRCSANRVYVAENSQ